MRVSSLHAARPNVRAGQPRKREIDLLARDAVRAAAGHESIVEQAERYVGSQPRHRSSLADRARRALLRQAAFNKQRSDDAKPFRGAVNLCPDEISECVGNEAVAKSLRICQQHLLDSLKSGLRAW